MNWRQTLLTLVEDAHWKTQGDLVEQMGLRGHQVTQATVSRELAALGATKVGGVYRLPAPEPLPAPVLSAQLAVGGGMVVVRTTPAHASVLAQAIDGAALAGVLGTVAGDDTVFVALGGPEGVLALRRIIGSIR